MAQHEIHISTHVYGVAEKTNIWSSPSEPHVLEKAPSGMTVSLVGSPTNSFGVDYFYAVIESPPDRKGETIWLAKLPKQSGWI